MYLLRDPTEVVAHQIDDGMVLTALLIVPPETLCCVRQASVDRPLHRVCRQFAAPKGHEALGREGDEAMGQEYPIGGARGAVDVL